MLSILCYITACSGNLFIEKSPNHTQEAHKIYKLVSIEPNFTLIDNRKSSYKSYNKSMVGEKNFGEILFKNAQKNGIRLQVVDANQLTDSLADDYFNHLLPLKQQILNANFLQNVTFDGKRFPIGEVFTNFINVERQTFVNTPSLPSNYSFLAEIYHTPYFAVHGLVSVIKANKVQWLWLLLFPPVGIHKAFVPDVYTYYYAVVVNVESSEILYREIRSLNDLANNSNLNAIIYDSFNILHTKQ